MNKEYNPYNPPVIYIAFFRASPCTIVLPQELPKDLVASSSGGDGPWETIPTLEVANCTTVWGLGFRAVDIKNLT